MRRRFAPGGLDPRLLVPRAERAALRACALASDWLGLTFFAGKRTCDFERVRPSQSDASAQARRAARNARGTSRRGPRPQRPTSAGAHRAQLSSAKRVPAVKLNNIESQMEHSMEHTDGMYTCSAGCRFDTDRNRQHLLHHVREGIYTEITCDELDLLPSRTDFQDPALTRAIAEKIALGDAMMFMPIVTTDRDEWPDRVRKSSIYMFGITPCGSKTCVVLRDLPIEYEVRAPAGMRGDAWMAAVRAELHAARCNFTGLTVTEHFPFIGFSVERVPYVRISFNCFADRKGAIDAMTKYAERNSVSLETASDDTGRTDYYWRKLARERGFNTCDWNRIEHYSSAPGLTRCRHTLVTRVEHVRKVGRKRKAALGREIRDILDRDRTVVAMWDIETYRTIQNGLVPTKDDTDFTIFNLCVSFFHQYTDRQLFSVCLMLCPAGYMIECADAADTDSTDAVANARVRQSLNAHERVSIAVSCADERALVCAWIDVMSRMSADIIGAYNGANFDWTLVREMARRYNLCLRMQQAFSMLQPNTRDTEESAYRWSWGNEVIKINAENRHTLPTVAKFPGMVDIDIMPIFMKMYPAAEIIFARGLNFFLAKNQLPGKEDMPYKRMFRIYERARAFAAPGAPRTCHCGAGADVGTCVNPHPDACAMCVQIVPDIDCIPGPAGDNGEPTYTGTLHADIASCCCVCGKRERNRRDLFRVGFYCYIDGLRLQQLCVKRVIVMDKRALGTSSFTSFYDSVYRADGMRVRNLLGRYAQRYDLAFSNSSVRRAPELKEHYPGAWVFPPIKGLNNRRPITGLDYASLYPNIIITFNRSPDMLVFDEATARALEAAGYTLARINPFQYERGEKKGAAGNTVHTAHGWTVRHNGIISRKDTNVITAHTKTITVRVGVDTMTFDDTAAADAECERLDAAGIAYARSHKYTPVRGRAALPQERLGIFGAVVKDLFDARVPIKAELVRLNKIRERMELAGVTTIDDTVDGIAVTLDYERDIMFAINKIDAKQRAIKVLANTFYGESGNFQSRVYALLVAAGVTTDGQAAIKAVAGFTTELGYTVYYGDSVTADTPIPVKRLVSPGGDLYVSQYVPVCDLATLVHGAKWQQYHGDKEVIDCAGGAGGAGGTGARACMLVWTNHGWTSVRKIIRHRTNARIFRVHTGTGIVDVTEHHSLLDTRAQRVVPEHALGVRLMHRDVFGQMTTIVDIDAMPPKLAAAYRYHEARLRSRDVGVALVHGEYQLPPREPDSERCTRVECIGTTNDYVYDLETVNGHFGAGVGNMIVHNTDSLYLECPQRYYAAIDERYAESIAQLATAASNGNGQQPTACDDTEYVQEIAVSEHGAARAQQLAARELYWHDMVAITMRVMTRLTEAVADYLLQYTGTTFMKMAYEEVGFPTVLCGKKKYYMTPHVETINFRPRDIFIRGIDIVKQGQTAIAKQLGEEFMRESLDIECERSLIEIARDKVRKFHETEWPIEKFVLYAKYKPTKKNVAVQTFVTRMRQAQSQNADPTLRALYEPPEPGDKFAYVVCARDRVYNTFGSRLGITKGDKMEYLRVYQWSQTHGEPLRLDMEHYFSSAVLGVISRFIVGQPDFQPTAPYDISDKRQYTLADQYMVNRASAYLTDYRNSLIGYDHAAIIGEGKLRRRVYKNADAQVRAHARRRFGDAADVLTHIGFDDGASGTDRATESATQQLFTQITQTSQCVDRVEATARAKLVVDKWLSRGMTIFEIFQAYCDRTSGIGCARTDRCKRNIDVTERGLRETLPPVVRVIAEYNRTFIAMVETAVNNAHALAGTDGSIVFEDTVNALSPDSVRAVNAVQTLWERLRALHRTRVETAAIIETISNRKMSHSGVDYIVAPRIDISKERTLHIPEFMWS